MDACDPWYYLKLTTYITPYLIFASLLCASNLQGVRAICEWIAQTARPQLTCLANSQPTTQPVTSRILPGYKVKVLTCNLIHLATLLNTVLFYHEIFQGRLCPRIIHC